MFTKIFTKTYSLLGMASSHCFAGPDWRNGANRILSRQVVLTHARDQIAGLHLRTTVPTYMYLSVRPEPGIGADMTYYQGCLMQPHQDTELPAGDDHSTDVRIPRTFYVVLKVLFAEVVQ